MIINDLLKILSTASYIHIDNNDRCDLYKGTKMDVPYWLLDFSIQRIEIKSDEATIVVSDGENDD